MTDFSPSISALLFDGGMDDDTATQFCPCCCADLHPDDFAPASEYPRIAAALVKRYGVMPCGGCADAHDVCADCGTATERDVMTEVGDDFYCDDCATKAESAYADEGRELRARISAGRRDSI